MSAKGQLSRDEVQERANKAFTFLEGLNAWDRRRILRKMESYNRK